MTDKTIINGVDVSGCFHLYPTRECDLNGHYPGFPKYCHEDPACYYKQSARKDERIMELEQQNAKLVEALERIIIHEEVNPTTIDELSELTVEGFLFRYQIIKAEESIALKNIAQQALEDKDDEKN